MPLIEVACFPITSVPLYEVDHFEAKCFILKKGESTQVWPQGSNSVINVEPADPCCGNNIYSDLGMSFRTEQGQ